MMPFCYTFLQLTPRVLAYYTQLVIENLQLHDDENHNRNNERMPARDDHLEMLKQANE